MDSFFGSACHPLVLSTTPAAPGAVKYRLQLDEVQGSPMDLSGVKGLGAPCQAISAIMECGRSTAVINIQMRGNEAAREIVWRGPSMACSGRNNNSAGVLVCWCVGVLVCWCAGVLVCWCVGVLVCWCVGVLVCWCVGVLVCWCAGVLVCWCVGVWCVVCCWCVGVLVCWCVGVLVCWCAGVLVCWCVGVLVCWCAAGKRPGARPCDQRQECRAGVVLVCRALFDF